jgi:hypothetical protein
MATNPRTTILPSRAGKGMAALLFPLCRIESSTILNIADIIKQQLQIKTILENVRMKKSYGFMSYELQVHPFQIITYKIIKENL